MDDCLALNWMPAVLSEYELGRAVWGAQLVAKSDKAISEVGSDSIEKIDALMGDLRWCLMQAVGDSAERGTTVKIWMRPFDHGRRVRYGFYREQWVLDALEFLDVAPLSDKDRAWIQGLLFGYRTDAIQGFIQHKISVTT